MNNNDVLILMNDNDDQIVRDYTIDSTTGTDKNAQKPKRKPLKKKQKSYDQLYLPDVGKKVLTSTEVHSDEEEGFEISIDRTRVGRNTSHASRKHMSHRIRIDRRYHHTLQHLTSHVDNQSSLKEMPYYYSCTLGNETRTKIHGNRAYASSTAPTASTVVQTEEKIPGSIPTQTHVDTSSKSTQTKQTNMRKRKRKLRLSKSKRKRSRQAVYMRKKRRKIKQNKRSNQKQCNATCNIRNCKNCRQMKYYENPPAKSVCSLFKNCINNVQNTKLMEARDYNNYNNNIYKMEAENNYLFGVNKSGM